MTAVAKLDSWYEATRKRMWDARLQVGGKLHWPGLTLPTLRLGSDCAGMEAAGTALKAMRLKHKLAFASDASKASRKWLKVNHSLLDAVVEGDEESCGQLCGQTGEILFVGSWKASSKASSMAIACAARPRPLQQVGQGLYPSGQPHDRRRSRTPMWPDQLARVPPRSLRLIISSMNPLCVDLKGSFKF